MSIFKSTLKPEIASQLKAREKLITSDSRGADFLRYTTGKNSWVRMTSFVNYDSKKYEEGKLVNDEKYGYKGDQLAKKYVLEGGTLFSSAENTFKLRAGVGKTDGVYASGIDKINANPSSGKVDRAYGLRPMPGITSVNITTKSAYGSLREAVVNFYCWDKHQLEELEILFMRTGYTVLLEWGWSQYVDHDVQTVDINTYPNLKGVKNYDTPPINAFDASITDQKIYDKIDTITDNTKGNYDALLGYVKNFSWQLMSNGGFQCNTTLISRGEIIEGIKASSNPNIVLGSYDQANSNLSENEAEKPMYSNFEKIFLNIIGHVNDNEFVNKFVYSGDSELIITGSLSSPDEETQKLLLAQADAVYNDVNTRLSKSVQSYISGNWDNNTIKNNGSITLDDQLLVKFADGKTEGTGIEYITLNAFIAILNEFFIYKNSKTNKNVVNIVLPYSTPCLASEDSVSIDPTTCLIQNSLADFVSNTAKGEGFSPQLFSSANNVKFGGSASYLTKIKGTKFEFLAPGTTNIGQIGNIFVSINKIVDIYRNLSGSSDGVDVLDLLQEILDACSFALGGINDFKLYTNKDIVQIIDTKYFENAPSKSKFKFDLIGLKSICRDVKINSRIFAEQSTMIAIGAGTSGGNTGNLGDVYSSTQTYFNKGLTDRIISATYDDPNQVDKLQVGSTFISGSDLYYYNIWKNVDALSNYIYNYVLGTDKGSFKVTKVPQSNQVINAGSLLKTIHYQLNGKDVDFKALIPFELEITLDGIGGLVIGQIFTVDKSILPRDYYNKNLGFIITGLSHILQNNDWVTNIKTQICLLENDKIAEKYSVDKSKLKQQIKAIQVSQAKNGYLMCAIADYLVNRYTYIISKVEGGKKIPSFDYDLITYLNSNIDGLKKDAEKMKFILDYLPSTESDIESYLRTWYTYGKAKGAPNYPATYDEFITPSGGGTSATLYSDINKILLNDIIGNADAVRRGSTKESNLKGAFESTFLSYALNANNAPALPIKIEISALGTAKQGLEPWYTTVNHVSVSANTRITNKNGSFTDNYVMPLDSFNILWTLFYNLAINASQYNPNFSIYSGPALGDPNFKSGTFAAINLEKPTKIVKESLVK